jgi:hypothetical protein
MLDLLDAGTGEEDFVAAFLAPPLYSTGNGFETLYTAVYRPADGAVDLRWPDATWRQAIDSFEEGKLSRSRSSRA